MTPGALQRVMGACYADWLLELIAILRCPNQVDVFGSRYTRYIESSYHSFLRVRIRYIRSEHVFRNVLFLLYFERYLFFQGITLLGKEEEVSLEEGCTGPSRKLILLLQRIRLDFLRQ